MAHHYLHQPTTTTPNTPILALTREQGVVTWEYYNFPHELAVKLANHVLGDGTLLGFCEQHGVALTSN